MKHELLAKAMQMHIDQCVEQGVVPKPFSELDKSTQESWVSQAARAMKTPRGSPTDQQGSVACSEWLERVNLAMLANGGEEWRRELCSCDPSVGMSPCEYCAIHEALRYTKAQIAPRSNDPHQRPAL